MKKLILFFLAFGIYVNGFTQNDLEPCCAVIKIDALKSIVTLRDKTTGQIHQFKANTSDTRGIQIGTDVNVSAGKITSINGAKKAYVAVRPDPIDPCCAVVNIQPDPIDPCCSAVTIQNNMTNNNFKLRVPKQIAGTLKLGQVVSMDSVNNLAIVQISYGGIDGEMNSFGYPASAGNETAGNGNAADKWVITPLKNMKSALGQLDLNFPAGLDWNIGNLSITRQADNKHITSFSGLVLRTKKSYNSAPGEYLIHLNNLPVENVPIQKGHVTKLKTGILKVDAEDRWEIYDESREKYLTSYNKPLKFAVPVGKYQVYIGGQYYPVTIKDGAMAVVPSANDVSLREAEDITTEPIIMAPPEETDFYVIKPGGSIPEGKGRLYIDLELSQYEEAIVRNLHCPVQVQSTSLCETPADLAPGTYNVSFQYPIFYDYPVVKEKKTRIKAGYLVITFDRAWELFRKLPTGGREKIHVGDNKVTYILPPGEYVLHVFGIVDWYYSTIKDKEIVVNGKQN